MRPHLALVMLLTFVGGCSGSDGPRRQDSGAEVEPNDSTGVATDIGAGSGTHRFSGEVNADGDDDMFRVVTSTPGAVTGAIVVEGAGSVIVEIWQNGNGFFPIGGTGSPAGEGEAEIAATLMQPGGEPLAEAFVVVASFPDSMGLTYEGTITVP